MTFKTLALAAAFCGAVCAFTLAQADQVYRWVDKNGQVHYSQTPPPASGVQAQVVNVEPPPPDLNGEQQTQQLENNMNAANTAQQKADAAAQKAAQKQAEQQKLCQAAQQRVQQLNDARRVTQTGANGQTSYYSGDDLVKLRQQAQEQVSKLCGGG